MGIWMVFTHHADPPKLIMAHWHLELECTKEEEEGGRDHNEDPHVFV